MKIRVDFSMTHDCSRSVPSLIVPSMSHVNWCYPFFAATHLVKKLKYLKENLLHTVDRPIPVGSWSTVYKSHLFQTNARLCARSGNERVGPARLLRMLCCSVLRAGKISE